MEIIYKDLNQIKTEDLFNINYGHGSLGDHPADEGYHLYPVLVNPDGLLLDGYKRYAYFSDQGRSNLPCIVVENAKSPTQCLEHRRITLVGNENPDIVQKLNLYQFLINCGSPPEEIKSWQRRLNLPSNSKTMQKQIRILSWPPKVQFYIHKYRLGFNQLKTLIDFELSEIELLFSLAINHNLRPVELINLGNLLKEISLNSSNAISGVLENREIKNIFLEYGANRNQLIHHLKSFLGKLRYPMISEYQSKMSAYLADLALCPDISIGYDKLFEAGHLNIIIKVSEINTLQKCLKDLATESNQKILLKILGMV